MASNLKNLSQYSDKNTKLLKDKKFGMIVSEWNETITNSLLEGALEVLLEQGAKRKNIIIQYVPGSFELSLGAQLLAQEKSIDTVITLGCGIQGETRHFDFICAAVAQGLTNVGLKYNKPIIFGVLTTNNMQQAIDRSGGKYGNKGKEAAITAIKMLNFKKAIPLF
jgi:6,7-dimethyl-8-ribityllumazine synthase